MVTQMKTDEDTASRLTPLLKTSPFVEMKQLANLKKNHNIESHKEREFKWTSSEHAYSEVYQAIDWEKKSEFYAYNSLKGLFCKDSFVMSQTERARYTNNVLDFDDNNSDTQSVQSAKYYNENQVQIRRSTRR